MVTEAPGEPRTWDLPTPSRPRPHTRRASSKFQVMTTVHVTTRTVPWHQNRGTRARCRERQPAPHGHQAPSAPSQLLGPDIGEDTGPQRACPGAAPDPRPHCSVGKGAPARWWTAQLGGTHRQRPCGLGPCSSRPVGWSSRLSWDPRLRSSELGGHRGQKGSWETRTSSSARTTADASPGKGRQLILPPHPTCVFQTIRSPLRAARGMPPERD